ncbi:hypothetical protein [[Mycobacterium] nativiensis]|uniref:Uncharacterized protein n=1 Tax=[Mycobacterium] nativiensis TaxID=2855503 RepID=A0ABU5Y3W9_9MYCO|nr:hypothetical protein [Mycolicibacter sp. MYC340]MEB3034777.1 hypothetical protein [Mycolicibacter sp. MYC340]
MTAPIELTRNVNGEPMMSTDAMALLFGVPAETVASHLGAALADTTGLTAVAMPPEWLRAGRRRTSEAAAATGSRELFAILAYWARRDLGAEVVFSDSESEQ